MTDIPKKRHPVGSADELREIARTRSTITLPEAGRFYGMGTNMAYELYKRGEFPVRVLKLGRKLVVPIAAVAADLGIDLSGGTS